MSKFSLDVLEKRVFPFVGTKDPDVMLGAAFGEDVALKTLLPQFVDLLPLYQNWLETGEPKARRSVEGAIRLLEGAHSQSSAP